MKLYSTLIVSVIKLTKSSFFATEKSYKGFTLISLLRHGRRSCEGFTLIELLITITIIALVSAVVIPGLRNFNRGQELDVAKSLLYDGLRLSQSKANSSIVCPNVDPTTISLDIVWAVVLRNDRFSLDYLCTDRASSTPQTHSGSEDRLYPIPTTVRMLSNSCGTGSAANNTRIEFSAQTCPSSSTTCRTLQITCGDGTSLYNFASGPFTITLTNDQSLTKMINISAGGAIYE